MQKYLVLIYFILIITLSCDDTINDNVDEYEYSWEIKKDSLNIAILAFEFDSSTFLGGTVMYDATDAVSLTDTIPFIIYSSNMIYVDGPIILILQTPVSGDTIFDYYFNPWGMLGSVNAPDTLFPPNSFNISTGSIQEPFYTETLFSFYYDENDSIFISKRDEIWEIAKKRDIVKDFAQNEYQVFTCLVYANQKRLLYLLLCQIL